VASLERLFSPRAVAVIGASPRPDALARRFTLALVRHRYGGQVVPVNPKYDEIDGLPCVPRVAEAPAQIDLAVVALGASAVPDALEDCGAAGVGGAVIFSSGFAETGEAGAEAQARIVAIAREHGMRLLGPNSPGLVNFTESVCALGLGVAYRSEMVQGGVSLISQSGGVGGLVCERAQDAGVGFSKFAAIGNEADVSAGELLRWYAGDRDTQLVALYLEGIRDPVDLVSGFEALARVGKRLVVLKPASSEAVMRATAAHTGALATQDDVFDAVLARYCAMRVHGVEEMVDVMIALDRLEQAASTRIGLISTSGGAAVLATQAADRAGLKLPAPAPATRERLAEVLPGFASLANPADTSGVFVEQPHVFGECLDIYADDRQYEAVVVILTVHPTELAERLATNLIDFGRDRERLPVVLWMAGDMSAPARARLRDAGFVVFEDADRCMRALAARAHERPAPPGGVAAGTAAPDSPRPLHDLPPGQVRDDRALGLVAEHRIGVPPMRTCASAGEARTSFEELGGGPVAVKAIGLAHKASAGGLVLDVTTSDEAARAHARVTAAGGDEHSSLMQSIAPRGTELIVGVRRDPGFGPVLVAGLGGAGAELGHAVSRRLLPLVDGDAAAMLQEAGIWELLESSRPGAPADAADAIHRLAALAESIGERLEAIEMNPLIVHTAEEGVSAVDVLLLTSS
jgi:acetate---CoA ligase (ADP-forming)